MINHGTDQIPETAQVAQVAPMENPVRLSDDQLALLIGHAVSATVSVATPYFTKLSADEAKAILSSGGHKRQIEALLAPLFTNNGDPHVAKRRYWENIFKVHYGIEVDFRNVRIPPKPTEGRWRLIGIAAGLTMNRAAAVYKKILVAHDSRCNLLKYSDDLDATVVKNARTSERSYFVWVRDSLGPDATYLGKSTCDADPDGLIGETLPERLVHGAVHFIETKKHLDVVGGTLCTGSRNSDGSIPYVYWNPSHRRVHVGWCDVVSRVLASALRQAVSA